MTVLQDDWNKFHHSGRILLLAPWFLIVSLTRKLKLQLGFHSEMLFQGKYAIPSGTTHYPEWNCKMYISIKELFKKLPTVKGNMFLVCSSSLRRTALICSLNLKSLNEHVQYHFKMDTLQSANRLMKQNCYRALVDLRDAYHSVPIDKEY